MTDLRARLGLAGRDLTAEQVEAFDRAVDAYYALPLHAKRDPDGAMVGVSEDDYALSAILQSILGGGSLEAAGRAVREADAALDGWVRAAAALGVSEVQISEEAGLSRPTVRKRLGK